MQLDYNLKTTDERIAFVNNLLSTGTFTKPELTYMSDYILFTAERNQTKKERQESSPIITRNREMTVSKRQVSLDQLIENSDKSEDDIYNYIKQDKNQLLTIKEKITPQDIEAIPALQQQFDLIESLKRQFLKADSAEKRYSLKRQIIESYQQAYIIKDAFTGATTRARIPYNQIRSMAHTSIPDDIYFDEAGLPQSKAQLSLLNPTHVSFLLHYYSFLKEESSDDLSSDMFFLLLDLENITMQALVDKPDKLDLLIWKIDGLSNEEIIEKMYWKYGVTHTDTYYSTIWRKKIPQLIVEEAQKEYLIWYYTNVEYGTWKQCGRCGKVKLAHPLFFWKNSTKDGYYSICKECKNAHK